MITEFRVNDPHNHDNRLDIAIMYRRELGLSYATSVHNWLRKNPRHFGNVYFSSDNSSANYMLDIPAVFGQALRIVVIVTNDFTIDFPQTLNDYQTGYIITAKEIGQIMRRYAEYCEHKPGVTCPELILLHYNNSQRFSKTDIDNLYRIARYERPDNETLVDKMVELFTCASENRISNRSESILDAYLDTVLGRFSIDRSPPNFEMSPSKVSICPYRIDSSSFKITPNFVAREQIISLIEQAVSDYQQIFIRGIGGIGKTWITNEFARQMLKAERYTPIVFLKYNIEKGLEYLIENELRIADVTANGSKYCTKSAAEKIDILRSYYPDKLLLIIDNFNTIAEKDEFFSVINNEAFHVIYTTQNKQGPKYFEILIPEMSDADLKQVFIKNLSRTPAGIDNDPDFQELFSLLGRHTLAVSLAASFFSQRNSFSTIRQLINSLKEQGVEIMADQEFSVDDVMKFQHLIHLDDLTADEQELLNIFISRDDARISTSEIDIIIALQLHRKSDESEADESMTGNKIDDALNKLVNRSFVLYDGVYYILHEIIQTILRYKKSAQSFNITNTDDTSGVNEHESASNNDEINNVVLSNDTMEEKHNTPELNYTEEAETMQSEILSSGESACKIIQFSFAEIQDSQDEKAEQFSIERKVSGSDIIDIIPEEKQVSNKIEKNNVNMDPPPMSPPISPLLISQMISENDSAPYPVIYFDNQSVSRNKNTKNLQKQEPTQIVKSDTAKENKSSVEINPFNLSTIDSEIKP